MVVALLLSACGSSSDPSPAASAPAQSVEAGYPAPPLEVDDPSLRLEGGYYVYQPPRSNPCGDYQRSLTVARDVTLHETRDLAAPAVASIRGGEAVNIVGCRVHFRPRRGEVLRSEDGFAAGDSLYSLYFNEEEWDTEYFEHTDVVHFVWYRGGIVEVRSEIPEDLFAWEPIAPGMSRNLRDAAGSGCWYQIEVRGVRGWGQTEDIDCYWTRR